MGVLEKNIIEMGLIIKENYTLLESENKQKTQQLIAQLYKDNLTELPNFNALLRDMEEDKQSYFAILNIKSFKNINDTFGFEVGNKILQEIADKITYIIQDHAVKLYRLGNDEFALKNTKKLKKR